MTTLTKEEIMSIRENAASIIVHMGWFSLPITVPTVNVEGKFPSPNFRHHECLYTAVLRVVENECGSSQYSYEHEIIDTQIAPALGFEHMCEGICWNNTPGRTMDEVVDRLLHYQV